MRKYAAGQIFQAIQFIAVRGSHCAPQVLTTCWGTVANLTDILSVALILPVLLPLLGRKAEKESQSYLRFSFSADRPIDSLLRKLIGLFNLLLNRDSDVASNPTVHQVVKLFEVKPSPRAYRSGKIREGAILAGGSGTK